MSGFSRCKLFAKFFKELLSSTLFFIMFSSLFRLYPIALSVILFLTSSCPVTCTVFSCFCCLSTSNGGSTVCDLFLYFSCAFGVFILCFIIFASSFSYSVIILTSDFVHKSFNGH